VDNVPMRRMLLANFSSVGEKKMTGHQVGEKTARNRKVGGRKTAKKKNEKRLVGTEDKGNRRGRGNKRKKLQSFPKAR